MDPSSSHDASRDSHGAPGAVGRRSGESEMDHSATQNPHLPLEEDIMQLARLGEIGGIQKLFATGKFDATYHDEEGITPLHVSPTSPSEPR